MPNSRLRQWLIYAVGLLLFAASLAFIVSYAARHWTEVAAVQLVAPAALGVSILLYAVSHLTTGLSWPLTLSQLREPIPLLTGFRIGLISQVGKYLPGNVAHYVGRSGLAARAGIPIRTSGISVVVELTSALAAGVLITALMLFIDHRPVSFLPKIGSSAILLSLAIVAGGAGIVSWSFRRGYSPALFIIPTLCLTVSFLLSGLSFHALAVALGNPELSMAAAIGSFALAWVAGFVLPGAPAGLGVREAILVSLVGPLIGPGSALTCVLLHRILTALVDGVAALLGYGAFAYASLAKK